MPLKLMKQNNIKLYIFIVTLFLSSILIVPQLFNPIQIPRLSFLLLGLSILTIYTWISKKTITFTITIPTALYFLFILWTASHIPIAYSMGDAAVGVIQHGLMLWLLYTVSNLYKTSKIQFTSLFSKTIIIIQSLCIVLLYIDIWQLPACSVFEDMYELRGLFGHKNISMSYLIISLPFVLYTYLTSYRFWKYIAIAILVADIALLICIDSRSSLLAIGGGLVCCIILWFKSYKTHITKVRTIGCITIIGILLGFTIRYIIFCGVLFPAHDGEINPLTDNYYYNRSDEQRTLLTSSALERYELWKKTGSMILDNPIHGVGMQQWKFHLNTYSLEGLIRSEVSDIIFTSPHNDFLAIAAETGIIGLLLYLGCIVYCIIFYYIYRKKFSLFEHVSFISIVLFCVIACFEFPHTILPLNILLIVSLATIHNHIKPLYSIVNNLLLFLLCAFILFSIFVMHQHVNGNIYSKRILNNRQKISMIQNCNNALSPWYTNDSYGMPIEWYKGTYYAETNQTNAAMKSFQKALQISPNSRYIHLDLATLYAILKDTAQSRKGFEHTLVISPNYDKARINYAIFLIQQTQYKKAFEILQHVNDTSISQYSQLQTHIQTQLK